MLPVPEIALNLIGKDRIRGWVDLRGGYNNRVWRVLGQDQAWIVKSFRSQWLRRNEAAAITQLGGLGLAPPTLFAQTATALIWQDDGLVPARALDEGMARSMGHALRRIHEAGPVAGSKDDADWRTVNRIGKGAAERSDYHSLTQGPVHGDARLGNALADASGRFVRFSDFEEFGRGDQVADLVLCLVETACDNPAMAERAVEWVVSGYVASGPGLLPAISDENVRRALAGAALAELSAWAESQGVGLLVERYVQGAGAAFDALSKLRPDHFR